MNKKTLIIIGSVGAVLMLCICVVVAGFVIKGIQDAGEIVKTIATPQAGELASTLQAVISTAAPEQDEAATATPEPQESSPRSMDIDKAREVANRMILKTSVKEYDEAVSLTNAKLRGNPGTSDALKNMVEEKGLDPFVWEWLKIDQDAEKQEVYLEGAVNTVDQRRGVITAHLMMEDGAWKVYYLDIQTDGDPVDPGAYSQWNEQREKEEVAFAKGEADLFFGDWIKDDFESAYKFSSESLRDQVGSADKLEEVLRGVGVYPSSWTWEDYTIVELENQERPVIELTGTVQFTEGKEGPATVQLNWEGGTWSVLYFDIQAK